MDSLLAVGDISGAFSEIVVKGRGNKVFSNPLENKTGEHPVLPVSAP
ncbi:MAG: hypothetical protein ACI9OH_003805 [Oleispira sp.]|jgi:hypothetical protein